MNSGNIKDNKTKQISELNSSNTTAFDNCICKVLIIDTDSHFRYVISNSLKYFSFNGNELKMIEAASLELAEQIIRNTDELILVIFNKMTFGINGQSDFLDLLRNYINKENGKVIFRYNGVSPKPYIDMTSSSFKINRHSEFEYARDRLIDLAQMAIVTYNNDNLNVKPANEENNGNNSAKMKEVSNEPEHITHPVVSKNDESLSSLKGNHLYEMLAHGLKGPIGNIKVLMDALTSDPDLFDEETSHKLLSNVRNSADSMNEMIDSFLFWSRIRKNELDFNPIRINVKNLILENINLLKGTAIQKDIDLQFDISDDVVAFADEIMMITVLRNLIYNAIKFTGRGGQVLAKVSAEGDKVSISVEDTGVGISAGDIKKIFDPEAHIATKGTENETGSGLGLLLCKDYVEKNGGRMSVESEEGKGSIFRFCIPKWRNISIN